MMILEVMTTTATWRCAECGTRYETKDTLHGEKIHPVESGDVFENCIVPKCWTCRDWKPEAAR